MITTVLPQTTDPVPGITAVVNSIPGITITFIPITAGLPR